MRVLAVSESPRKPKLRQEVWGSQGEWGRFVHRGSEHRRGGATPKNTSDILWNFSDQFLAIQVARQVSFLLVAHALDLRFHPPSLPAGAAHRPPGALHDEFTGAPFVRACLALEGTEFAQIDVPTLSYMDVTLKGRVADLAAREKARKSVDEIRGLRCREQDNFIQVTAKLNGQFEGKRLLVSGWLHDEATLRDAAQWLAAARPGIEVVTDDVQVSPHVTFEEAPSPGGVPAAFRPVWSAIEVAASLHVLREGTKLTVSGHLPSATLTDAVVAALTMEGEAGFVEAAGLTSGVYVRSAKFAAESLLPAFLKACFSTPGAVEFEADASRVRVTADATPTMQREWQEMLEPLAREAELQTQFRIHPSVYHFPGRTRESKGAGEMLAALQEVLRASTISFGPGYATPGVTEQPKIASVASAIIAAGPEVRVVAGGHMDLTGSPKDNATMARRRSEGVVADLVSKGVSPHVLEARPSSRSLQARRTTAGKSNSSSSKQPEVLRPCRRVLHHSLKS